MATIRIGKQGRIVIPAELREEMDLRPGDQLNARIEDERLVLERREQILKNLQARFTRATGGRSVVDELIAERRAEAAREEKELEG